MRVFKSTVSATELAACNNLIPVPIDQNGDEIMGLLEDPHPSDQALFPRIRTDSRPETLPSNQKRQVFP